MCLHVQGECQQVEWIVEACDTSTWSEQGLGVSSCTGPQARGSVCLVRTHEAAGAVSVGVNDRVSVLSGQLWL